MIQFVSMVFIAMMIIALINHVQITGIVEILVAQITIVIIKMFQG